MYKDLLTERDIKKTPVPNLIREARLANLFRELTGFVGHVVSDVETETGDQSKHKQVSNGQRGGAVPGAEAPVDEVEKRVKQVREHQRDSKDEECFTDKVNYTHKQQ